MISGTNRLIFLSRVSTVANHAHSTAHTSVTRRRNLSYQFTSKHHGGKKGQARWLPALTDAEEFSVFDQADFLEISNSKGDLFGILRDEDGELRIIGCWLEQLAKFPFTRKGTPWHGYPCWLLSREAPKNRKKGAPTKKIFQKLKDKGVITEQQRKRFANGGDA